MPYPDSKYPPAPQGQAPAGTFAAMEKRHIAGLTERDLRSRQRLMAAAPEMLAALKMWMELETTCDGRRPCYCDDPEVTQHGKCYACAAESAIAKAEGRSDE
jgi:hypothetical protein